MDIFRFANPTRFMGFAERWVWILWVLSLAALGYGLFLIATATPPSELHGHNIRLLFVHVPSAWLALFSYSAMAAASLVGLIWRHPLADVFAMAAAPLGAMFTALALLTGSIWGNAAWGTWWMWSDSRMTSTLILFLQFVAYIVLVNSFDDPARGRRVGAWLIIIGIANVFIVKYGVNWFNSLHQQASVDASGSSISGVYLRQLFSMLIGFNLLFVALVIGRMRVELDRLRLAQRRAKQKRQAITAGFATGAATEA